MTGGVIVAGGIDLSVALGELLDEVITDAVDLPLLAAGTRQGTWRERHAKARREPVHEVVVIGLRHGHKRRKQCPVRVQGPPFSVVRLHTVGDDKMSMKMRVARA